MVSVAREIVEINEVLNKYVQIEKHNGPEGAAITWAMNRLARLAADAEFRLSNGTAPKALAPAPPTSEPMDWGDPRNPLPPAPGEDDCESCQ